MIKKTTFGCAIGYKVGVEKTRHSMKFDLKKVNFGGRVMLKNIKRLQRTIRLKKVEAECSGDSRTQKVRGQRWV